MDRKQLKRPAQGSRKNPGSKRPPSGIADALGGEKLKGASAVRESISLTHVLGGEAVGWEPGSPSPSFLERRPPARARSEMPTLTTLGRNRPGLVRRSRKGASSRQTHIESLPPDQRQEQKTWAPEKLKEMPTTCPYGFKWKRVKGGYRCGADLCFFTDELLAEGKEYRCPPWVTLPQFGPAYPVNTGKAHRNARVLQTRSSSDNLCNSQ